MRFNRKVFFIISVLFGISTVVRAEQIPPMVTAEFYSDVSDENLIVGTEIGIDFIIQAKDPLKDLNIEITLPLDTVLIEGELKKNFKFVKRGTKLKLSFRVRLLTTSVQTIKANIMANEEQYNFYDDEEFIFILNQKFLEKPLYEK